MKVRSWFKQCENLLHIAAFIVELQHFKNLKPSFLRICKWAISPFLSDQVTFCEACNEKVCLNYTYLCSW